MRAREALRPGVDWSQVAAQECFDCGTDDLPGVFAELGRRARGEVRYEESDFWAPVREDVAWPGLGEAGGGCGCGGSCGGAACGGGETEEVDDFWAPVVEGGPLRTMGIGERARPLGRRPGHGRIASQSGPQSASEREESQEAERTNAIFATGLPDLISSYVDALESGDEAVLNAWWMEHGEDVWGDTGLAPPPDGGTCSDALRGDSTCNRLASDDQRALPDLEEYGEREVPIQFIDKRDGVEGCDSQLESLIRAAWSMLQDNIDLVNWARCYVFGRKSSGQVKMSCLRDTILGSDEKIVKIYLQSGESLIDPGAAAEGWWGWKIVIFGEDSFWKRRLSYWCCSVSDKTKTCMAISVAALIFHELVHYCGRSKDSGKNVDNCEWSYLAQSVIHWALLNRYPAAGSGNCCRKLVGDGSIFAGGMRSSDVGIDCPILECP